MSYCYSNYPTIKNEIWSDKKNWYGNLEFLKLFNQRVVLVVQINTFFLDFTLPASPRAYINAWQNKGPLSLEI